jgi:ABC-type polysaccharide/polyol phosphate export permease
MGRFHGSFLGAWWMLVQPTFQFLVYYFVFGLLFGRPDIGQEPNGSYAIYLFSGVLVFNSLVEATGQGVNIVTGNSSLVKKVAFPSEALMVPPALVSLVLYVVGAIVCFPIGLALGVLHPGWPMLALPLVLIAQFALTVGLGLLLGNLNVFIRDVQQLWRILSMAWMFVTPIFWTPDLLEKSPLGGTFFEYAILHLNPAYPLVMAHRIALGGQSPLLGDFWVHLGTLSLWAVVLLVLGYSSFMSKKHKYADLI